MLISKDISIDFPGINLLTKESVLLEDCEQTVELKNDTSKPFALIFGNDKDTRFLFKTTLEIWDFEVAEVENTAQSLVAAETRRPDLVIMDTEFEFIESFLSLETLRKCQLFDESLFVLLSGHAQENVRQLATAAGADSFFVKPVDFEEFEKYLKIHLGAEENIKKAEAFDE